MDSSRQRRVVTQVIRDRLDEPGKPSGDFVVGRGRSVRSGKATGSPCPNRTHPNCRTRMVVLVMAAVTGTSASGGDRPADARTAAVDVSAESMEGDWR